MEALAASVAFVALVHYMTSARLERHACAHNGLHNHNNPHSENEVVTCTADAKAAAQAGARTEFFAMSNENPVVNDLMEVGVFRISDPGEDVGSCREYPNCAGAGDRA